MRLIDYDMSYSDPRWVPSFCLTIRFNILARQFVKSRPGGEACLM
jgi:hypothetical protein